MIIHRLVSQLLHYMWRAKGFKPTVREPAVLGAADGVIGPPSNFEALLQIVQFCYSDRL
jgi:hypothetical protein